MHKSFIKYSHFHLNFPQVDRYSQSGRLTRSKAGDWSQVVHRSPHSVARGLARAFHSYLTNVIVGVDGVSWPHRRALHDYLAKQHLRNDEFTWIGDKVFVLFPDSGRVKDSVADLLQREKVKGECHGIVNQVCVVFATLHFDIFSHYHFEGRNLKPLPQNDGTIFTNFVV